MNRPAMVGAPVLFVTLLVAASCGQGAEPVRSPSPTSALASGTTAPPAPTETSSPTTPSASPTEPPASTWHRALDFSVAALDADDEGNVYVTGFVPFGPAEELGQAVEMVTAKVEPDGRPLWSQTWRSTSRRFPDAAGRDVTISPDGSVVYVGGAIMLPPWEAERPWLWAYSSEGDLLWSRAVARYGGTSATAAGATGVIAGASGLVIAFGSDGSRLWVRPFEDPAGDHCDSVTDVALGDRGEVYAAGFLDRTPTCGAIEGGAYEDADIVVQKRSPSGDLLWSRVLTDPGVTDNDRALAVDVAGGTIVVAGERDGRAWLARLSTDGEIAWERVWGEPGWPASAVSVAPWDALYVLGPPRGLIRLTTDGDVLWNRRLQLSPGESPSGLATSPGDAIFVTADVFSVEGDLWRLPP